MRVFGRWLPGILFVAILAGCGSDGTSATDAGGDGMAGPVPDGSPPDAASPEDGGAPDAGKPAVCGVPTATLGSDLYCEICKNIAHAGLPEDTTGESYAAACQGGPSGYANAVDTTSLPTPANPAIRARTVAKIAALSNHRDAMIAALDHVFPDTTSAGADGGAPIRLLQAWLDLSTAAASSLYSTDPFDAGAPPFPTADRSVASLMNALASSSATQAALSGTTGRSGYRPAPATYGPLGALASDPALQSLLATLSDVLGPGGAGAAPFEQFLTVLKQELLNAQVTQSNLPPLAVDAGVAQPSRPRSDVELAAAWLLAPDAEAPPDAGNPVYFVQRDVRGQAALPPGPVQPPFVALDGGTLPAVDAYGRFVSASGQAIGAAPFGPPGDVDPTLDPSGRPQPLLFAYTDVTHALLGGFAGDLAALSDPTQVAAAGDPNAYQVENEATAYALAGLRLVAGPRMPAMQTYAGGGTVTYSQFVGPAIPDFAHAIGQILADPGSDALLLGLEDLLVNHPTTVARFVAALMSIRDIVAAHDAAAAAGTEPLASMPYATPVWDQIAQVLSALAERPGALTAIVASLADGTLASSSGTVSPAGTALASLMHFKDAMDYDPHGTHYDGTPGGINGPANNLTVDPNGGSQAAPQTPVDRSAPLAGVNRSLFQRQILALTQMQGQWCNKDGATVAFEAGGQSVTWPITGFPVYASPYSECQFLQIDDVSAFYLDSWLPATHPKRATLTFDASTFNSVLSYLGSTETPDELLTESSDIAGFTQRPTPEALARFFYFGASTSNPAFAAMPDFDTANAGTQVDKFVSGIADPASGADCPLDTNGVPACPDPTDTFRVHLADTVFGFEQFNTMTYLTPLVTALADEACDATVTTCDTTNIEGEASLLQALAAFSEHWPGPDHGAECSSTGSLATNPDYCSGAGINRYEPILIDVLGSSDFIGAMNELASVLADLQSIVVVRGPTAGTSLTGAQLVEDWVRILFDQTYAQSVGMVDRSGNASTTWTDGTPQAQLTPFTLLANALHESDLAFQNACNGLSGTALAQCQADASQRQGEWQRARKLLQDRFFTVTGTGSGAAFANAGTLPALTSFVELLREQVNANCPGRENGVTCTWGRSTLGANVASTVGSPLFAATMDALEAVRANETARRQLEASLGRALTDPVARVGMLSWLGDLAGVLADDRNAAPIMNGLAPIAAPAGDPAGRGTLDATTRLLEALLALDTHGVVGPALGRIMAPSEPGDVPATPLDVFVAALVDVERAAPGDGGPLDPSDFASIANDERGYWSGTDQEWAVLRDHLAARLSGDAGVTDASAGD